MKTIKQFAVLILCIGFVFSSARISAQSATQNYKTIYDMLKDVPGVEVRTNNGRGNSVIIRGTGTLMASTNPLFVVDGAIFSGDISNLNPQDVANIIVLKDAASTTAYGAQGANGVISITMKKGAVINGPVTSATEHKESAYTYFIDHKTPLKVFDMNENVIVEGVIQKQKGDSLVFVKKRKDFMVAISSIKRVEMVKED